MPKNPKVRRWCFTVDIGTVDELADKTYKSWNGPIDEDHAKEHNIKYIRYSMECGENGRFHWQGYITMGSPTRMEAVKTAMSCRWVHLEPCISTERKNDNYVAKDPIGEEYEWGVHTTQGMRTDMDHCKALLDEGNDLGSVFEHHFGNAVRYHAGFSKYIEMKQQAEPPVMREVVVKVYWGVPGTGKSFGAYEFDFNLYNKPLGEGESKWWDDYTGQTTLLLDDFTGQISIQVLRFLNCALFHLLGAQEDSGQVPLQD